MDWTVYWFMLPVCVVVAGLAMFSGISGAAMLTPFFLIGFPLLGVPTLTTVAAIGTSLFLETSGFGSGVTRGTVNWDEIDSRQGAPRMVKRIFFRRSGTLNAFTNARNKLMRMGTQ